MSELGEQQVVVTLKDVYIEVRRLQDTVAAMTPQAEKLNDHEVRLRSLEKWRYALPTSLVIAVISTVADAIVLTKR